MLSFLLCLGDFSMATVNLSNNNLTRFESAAFLTILEQMNLPFADGYVDLESSTNNFF